MEVVSAKEVMALRQRTGMGMMECKKALAQAGGDLGRAVDILRKAAKGKMDERTDRAAAEGALAAATNPDATAVALVEINCETDFVARTDAFMNAVARIAGLALDQPAGQVPCDDRISKIIDELRITTKENISFARGLKLQAPPGGQVGSYVHHNHKVAGAVAVSAPADAELLLGLCQHVAAHSPCPTAVDEAGLGASDVAKVRGEFEEEAKASGKPPEVAQKMAVGKLRKWTQERTLLGQIYVKDMTGKTPVKAILPKGLQVLTFARYAVGVK